MENEASVTILGEKGQIVIPKSVRDRMGVKPRTRFVVFGQGDVIVLKRIELPDLAREWVRLHAALDRKGLRMTEQEIAREVDAVRRGKRTRGAK